MSKIKIPTVSKSPCITSCHTTTFNPPTYVLKLKNSQPKIIPTVIFKPIVKFKIDAIATNCMPVIEQYANKKLIAVGILAASPYFNAEKSPIVTILYSSPIKRILFKKNEASTITANNIVICIHICPIPSTRPFSVYPRSVAPPTPVPTNVNISGNIDTFLLAIL